MALTSWFVVRSMALTAAALSDENEVRTDSRWVLEVGLRGLTSGISEVSASFCSHLTSTSKRRAMRPYSLKTVRSGSNFEAYRPSSGDRAVAVS